jgi:hypothetical protein
MSDSEMSKGTVTYNPEGKRRAGRPKAKWIDAVENNVRKAGVRNWRTEAKDRVGWRRIVEEDKYICRAVVPLMMIMMMMM